MKKIFLSLSLILFSAFLWAQVPSNRSAQTIVADVVAQMPAPNQQDYNRLVADLASTGEDGVLQLLSMLQPVGRGSNASIEYAISALSRYAMENDKSSFRSIIEQAYIKGLKNLSDNENKKFIISQLQLIGTDESVNTLSELLTNPDLAGPAARALSSIASPRAQQTLRSVAASVKDAEIALGEIEKRNGVQLTIIDTKKDLKSPDVHKRIAALQAVLVTSPDKASKQILAAMKDPSIEYRNAALEFASSFADERLYIDLLKYMQKAPTDVKVDILNWTGREAVCPDKNQVLKNLELRFDLTARDAIIEQIKKGSYPVKEAAAWTLTKIGDEKVIPVLAGLLTAPDKETVLVGRNTLLAFKGNVSPAVAKVIPSATDEGKIAAVEILANRKANPQINTVLELIRSGSPEVKVVSYNALKDLVTYKNWVTICGMLESTEPEFVAPLQQAAISAISSLPVGEQVSVINTRMLQAGESNKHLYYIVLASTGNSQAFASIVHGFNQGGKNAKASAFEALVAWKGVDAAEELFAIATRIGEPDYSKKALNAYIQLASHPSLTGENQLLRLRKAMEIAQTDEQKNQILKRVERTGTFLAMIYAGEFLDQQTLQQAAAGAVMNIALSHPEYTGQVVKDLLNKVSPILDNPDADYQRAAIRKHLNEMPDEEGYVSIFNGKDLTGWKGLVENPIKRRNMTPAQLNRAQLKADEQMRKDWFVQDGMLIFDGTGYDNLCTIKEYGDIEMYIDWMLDPAGPEADGGIYLRGTPQVQIWDIARTNVGAQVGSGGLYNNQVHESSPLKVADNKMGEWNTFYIKMVGDRVTVKLNGELVTDDVILENFWDRKQPIFPKEQLELQAHGSKVYYRNIYVKELPHPEPFTLSDEEKKEGYRILFDGTNMHYWTGNTVDYTLDNGCISMIPSKSYGGNLYTKEEFGNFIIRFEFQLTPAANNGLGIRTPMEGDAAYVGMELQILDSEHPVYKDLKDYQYHGSVYGIIPAKRGYLKPVGEWNYQEVIANGDHIKITLNGHVILDGNIRDAVKNGTPDGQEHPGLFNKKGHIAFLGHGSPVKFRNIRLKELK